MAEHKSAVVDEVFRQHFNNCFFNIPKDLADQLKTCNIPSPEQARNTPFNSATVVVDDVSIRVNMFGMGDYKPTGKNFLAFLLADVFRAFAHPNIHTYMMAADLSCFGDPAKAPVQQGRLRKALEQAKRDNIEPIQWNPDEPTSIIDINREVPKLLAMQCTSGALRYALFEAMTLISETFRCPPGKRLVLLMEPCQYTNPSCIEDFMPTDPSTGIVIAADRAKEVEEARAELAAKASKMTIPQFRRAAREKTKFLAQTGCFSIVPICCETDERGTSFQPFRLQKMKFQSGEADLSIQRCITYFYTGAIQLRLAGNRNIPAVQLAPSSYNNDQLSSLVNAMTDSTQSPYVGPDGNNTIQRCVVTSTDSDFIMLMAYTMAVLVAKHDAKQDASVPDGVTYHSPHSPLLIRGAVFTKTRDRLPRGMTRIYYTENSAMPFRILKSFEMFDPLAMYSEMCLGETFTKSPLQIVIDDAARRQAQSNAKRKETLEKKRALNAAESSTVVAKKAKTETGAKFDEEEHPGVVMLLPKIGTPDNADVRFQRFASMFMLTVLMGNDYLGGLTGTSRSWIYAAYMEMLYRDPTRFLVRVIRLISSTEAAPDLPMYIDYEVFEQLIRWSYYMNLMAQPCATNKPTIPLERLTMADIRFAVVMKYPNKPSYHIPDDQTLLRVAMRLTWVLRYATNGSSSIRHIIDSTKFGWEEQWASVIV